MARLRLRAEARADLVEIDEYSVTQFGDEVASSYTRGLREAFGRLREHPLSGAARPEPGENIRCLVHRSHRIFYAVQADNVLIIRVVHHAMDARHTLKGAVGL